MKPYPFGDYIFQTNNPDDILSNGYESFPRHRIETTHGNENMLNILSDEVSEAYKLLKSITIEEAKDFCLVLRYLAKGTFPTNLKLKIKCLTGTISIGIPDSDNTASKIFKSKDFSVITDRRSTYRDFHSLFSEDGQLAKYLNGIFYPAS